MVYLLKCASYYQSRGCILCLPLTIVSTGVQQWILHACTYSAYQALLFPLPPRALVEVNCMPYSKFMIVTDLPIEMCPPCWPVGGVATSIVAFLSSVQQWGVQNYSTCTNTLIMKQTHNPEQWLWPHMYSHGNNTTVCQLLKDVVCYQKLVANVHVVCFQCTYHKLYTIYKVSELQVGMTCVLSLEVLLHLRWHYSLSAKVNKNAILGVQSWPGLVLVSGLGFHLGLPCLILNRVLVAH